MDSLWGWEEIEEDLDKELLVDVETLREPGDKVDVGESDAQHGWFEKSRVSRNEEYRSDSPVG